MTRVVIKVRRPLDKPTPRRYPRQSVLDQLDSEGWSDLVNQYRALVKPGPVDYTDASHTKTIVGVDQTGTHNPGEGGAYR